MVAIELSTPAPKARPALTATVTQADGESAIATLRMTFPKAFGFNERFRPPRCQPDDEEAMTCPEASRVGAIAADSPLGAATGDVYITDDFRLVAFAQALGGLVQIKAEGEVSVTKRGQFAVTFTGLPDLPVRSTTLALEGGDRALLKNPRRCATYRLPARFTSHQDETATATSTVTVSGCRRPRSGSI